MSRLAFLFALLIAGTAEAACPSGSTCETFQGFSGIIKLIATGNATSDTNNFKAALAQCGPNRSISFFGTMQISSPGLGDPPVGCEITGYDTDPYEGGSGAPGASQLMGNGTSGWPTGSAIIGSNDGVTYQHFTINGNFANTGNCVNVHNVQGFTALYVHVYQCLTGWNVLSDGNDASHSQKYSHDIQIWNSENMRNGIAGIQISAINGGSNTDIQVINNTYSQNGNSPSNACNVTEPGNVSLLAGTTGYIHIGSRNEDAFCSGNRSWDLEGANRVTVFGAQSDMVDDYSVYVNGGSGITFVGTEFTNAHWTGSFTNRGPFIHLGGTIDRFIMFGGNIVVASTGCVYNADGVTITNSAFYEQPYGAAAFCDSATSTALTPFFVSSDRSFP
jgi:hypothetical protein